MLPEDYDFETQLSWSTTDSHVAVVNADGVITAVGVGEADIICEATNGCMAQCHVSVPEPEFYFVIWFKDGGKFVTHLQEKPMLMYVDEGYTFVTSTAETRYEASDVVKITLSDNPDGNSSIDNILQDDENDVSSYDFDDETMVISGGSPGAVTRVLSLSGVLVSIFRADGEGCTVVPLAELPTGVLIIQSEKITYKIIKK